MKRARSALARKGEVVRRKIHGNAHVDRNYAEADAFMSVFQEVTDEFCWGTVWARRGGTHKTRGSFSPLLGGGSRIRRAPLCRSSWRPPKTIPAPSNFT